MLIKPSEIDSVESIGILDDDEVRMVRTVGGLYLAVGKQRGKTQEEVLAAGSHPGIVKYNVEKAFKAYQPMLEKSEQEHETVEGLTDLLPKEMVKKGYELYSLEKSQKTEFILAKTGIEVNKYELSLQDDSIVISKPTNPIIPETMGMIGAVIAVSANLAAVMGKTNIFHAGKTYEAKRVLKA